MSRFFDLAINKKGNGNSKITMGLYWIAPNSFLNLDSRNEWYIYRSGKIPADVVQGLPAIEAKIAASKYFDIVEKLRNYLQSEASSLKDFKDLSFEAWRYSEEVNEEQRAAAKAESEKGAAVADEDVETTHYWIYSPGDGAAYWNEFYEAGIMAIGWDIGNLKDYSSKEQMKQTMKDRFDPSMECVKLVLEHLPIVLKTPECEASRLAMSRAALYGGNAINEQLAGYIHAFAHSIGAVYHIPHGNAIALSLLPVMRFQKAVCLQKLAELSLYCGISEKTDDAQVAADKLLNAVERLIFLCDFTDRGAFIPPEDYPILTKRITDDSINYSAPVVMTKKDISRILDEINSIKEEAHVHGS